MSVTYLNWLNGLGIKSASVIFHNGNMPHLKKEERERKSPVQSRPLPKEKHSCPALRKPAACQCLSGPVSGPDVHSIKLRNTQVLELSLPPVPINRVLQKRIRKWPLPIIHTSFLRKGTSFPWSFSLLRSPPQGLLLEWGSWRAPYGSESLIATFTR